MVRVLQVVTYMGRGGLETMLMNYYRHMDRSIVQFDFLVHREEQADYDEEIVRSGGRIYHISRLVPWSRRYRNEVKSFFWNHPEYRIVHVHQDCLSSVVLQCAKECKVPVRIAHSHSGGAKKDEKYPIRMFYQRKIPTYATELFACGRRAGAWMFHGYDFAVLPNAIDLKQYAEPEASEEQVRRTWGLTGSVVIGHVGNFTPAKNHTFLFQIFQKIRQKEPRAKLFLVGGGPGLQAARKRVNRMHLSESVIFAGIRSDVPELLLAMNVFVFPSLYEGIPVSVMEAQAAGLPCVLSDQVSEECIVTRGLVERRSLSDSTEQWADVILKQSARKREYHTEEIRKAGYDISDAAAKLEQYYIQKNEEESYGIVDGIYPFV